MITFDILLIKSTKHGSVTESGIKRMMGNMTKATPVIIFNVRSLDVASHKVKLWLGSKLDGMMKGNIAKPAVKIIQAFVTLAQTKVIASFSISH